jgi:hypothetical protein
MSATVLEWFIRIAFAFVSIIHLLPVAGVLGRPALERAYGVTLASSDLVILLQHRALMFGLLAGVCLYAAVTPAWRWPVAIIALISMLSFVIIAWMHPHNAAITRVIWADVLASAVLLCALICIAWKGAQ